MNNYSREENMIAFLHDVINLADCIVTNRDEKEKESYEKRIGIVVQFGEDEAYYDKHDIKYFKHFLEKLLNLKYGG